MSGGKGGYRDIGCTFAHPEAIQNVLRNSGVKVSSSKKVAVAPDGSQHYDPDLRWIWFRFLPNQPQARRVNRGLTRHRRWRKVRWGVTRFRLPAKSLPRLFVQGHEDLLERATNIVGWARYRAEAALQPAEADRARCAALRHRQCADWLHWCKEVQ